MENSKLIYDKSDETFQYLMSTLKDSIKGWDYFVNWKKVVKNVENIEIYLNILNYLVGKDNIKEELKKLLTQYPEILSVVPVLIASRENQFQILMPSLSGEVNFELEEYCFKPKKILIEEDIDNAVEFMDKTGILELIKNRKIKNLVDYVYGVEVGLDSNGRKNRSGTSMENLVELLIKDICIKYGYDYIVQATPARIKEKWNLSINVDKADRRFDFAVYTISKLYLIETNYYGGGGSKLKATAGEYKTLQYIVSNNGYELIWITDGKGWLTASKSLRETFDNNKYILNLDMVQNGILEDIINNEL